MIARPSDSGRLSIGSTKLEDRLPINSAAARSLIDEGGELLGPLVRPRRLQCQFTTVGGSRVNLSDLCPAEVPLGSSYVVTT